MKLSIVIPIFNVEKYLNECLTSIVEIKYKDIEIILVNDGSTDSSAAVIEEFTKKYGDILHIKVIEKPNGGLADARNVGFLNSTGDYIVFLDSDDYILGEQLVFLLNEAISNDLEICIGDYSKFDDESKVRIPHPSRKATVNKVLAELDVLSGQDYLEKSFDGKEIEVVAWRSIYKRQFLESCPNIFVKGLIYEDTLFTMSNFFWAKKVKYYNCCFYMYRQRGNSIMSTKNIKKMHSKIYILHELLKIYKDRELKSYVWSHLIVAMYFSVLREYKVKSSELWLGINTLNCISFANKMKTKLIFLYGSFFCKELQLSHEEVL